MLTSPKRCFFRYVCVLFIFHSLLCFLVVYQFSIWWSGSGAVLDCIDSWYLPFSLVFSDIFVIFYCCKIRAESYVFRMLPNSTEKYNKIYLIRVLWNQRTNSASLFIMLWYCVQHTLLKVANCVLTTGPHICIFVEIAFQIYKDYYIILNIWPTFDINHS